MCVCVCVRMCVYFISSSILILSQHLNFVVFFPQEYCMILTAKEK